MQAEPGITQREKKSLDPIGLIETHEAVIPLALDLTLSGAPTVKSFAFYPATRSHP